MGPRARTSTTLAAALGAVLALTASASAAPGDGSPLAERLTRILDRPDELRAMRLVRLELTERRAVIGLELPKSIDLADLPPAVENAYEVAVGAIAGDRPAIDRIDLLVAHPGEVLRPPPRHLSGSTGAPPRRELVLPDPARFPLGQRLTGKTIAISPGHGYIWYDNLGRYSTQRGRIAWEGCGDCRGIVEDFGTHELVMRHLVPLLEGAGARVVIVRERSYAGARAIEEDGGATYRETAGTFVDGSSAGGWSGAYRASTEPGAAVRYTLAAPLAGPQLLSMWFVPGGNRVADARLEVTGAFGAWTFLLDQRTHGLRWVPVGFVDLDVGQRIEVAMSSTSMTPGTALVADAVRLGAGVHEATGYPWWQMGAQPFSDDQGAPADVTSRGDVTARPRWAEAFGADVYLSVHSNASGIENSTANGIASYRYNCGTFADHSNDPPASDCDDPSGSDRLQALVHSAMVRHIKGGWDPAFYDRGTKVANFGELRELDGIPGVLVESAFHDNVRLSDTSQLRATDNQSLHDPRWRRLAAYGLYEGLSEFLAGPGTLVAAPPAAVVAKRRSATSIDVDFTPVEGAASYRVYVARNGRTFDQGTIVPAPPATIDGLPAEGVVFVKVAALNEAGEGLASNVVTARASARRAQLLFVDSFEREDAWIQDVDNLKSTLMVHGAAAASRDAAFDGATEAALTAGLVSLDGYDAVVIALGAESTEHEILTADLRTRVAAFASSGKAVFASGSELAWALDARGTDDTRAFFAEVFGAAYGRDDAGTLALRAAAGGWLEGQVGAIEIDDGTRGGLRARSLDVLTPTGTGVAELFYGDGATDVAGVRNGKSLVLGTPLDSIVGADTRSAIVGAWIDQAITIVPVDPLPDGGVIVPDAGETPDSGIGEADGGIDAGSGLPDAAAPDAEAPAGLRRKASGETPISGGCGCTAAHGGATPWTALALV
ncbi:N-acetylmuramoyl-L-alanine amidase, partial [Myxococcota bacterium]|nr:N-acetylmuramoyl-L-alanine amidase [Myxococcota bacterium]